MITTVVVAGAAAVIGAFVAGEVFVKNSDNSASLAMAILTGAALLCYIALHAIITRHAITSRQQSLARESAVGHRTEIAEQ